MEIASGTYITLRAWADNQLITNHIDLSSVRFLPTKSIRGMCHVNSAHASMQCLCELSLWHYTPHYFR